MVITQVREKNFLENLGFLSYLFYEPKLLIGCDLGTHHIQVTTSNLLLSYP